MKTASAAAILLLLAVQVLFFIPVTPPSELSWSRGLWGDEGNLLHNVRNYQLAKVLVTDSCNFFTLSPLYFLVNLMFSFVIPLKIWCFRLVNSIIGAVCLFYFSYRIMKRAVRWVLMFYLAILSNVFIFFYFKSALAETLMLSMLFISVAAFLEDRFKCAAFFFLMSFMAKIFAVCFFPIYILHDFLSHGYRISAGCRTFITFLLLFFVLLYIPFGAGFRSMIMQGDNLPREITKQFPDSVERIAGNVFSCLYNRILTKNLFLFAAFLFLMMMTEKIGKTELFGYLWFFSVVAFLAPQEYRPVRYYINLLIPMNMVVFSFLQTRDQHRECHLNVLLKVLIMASLIPAFLLVSGVPAEGFRIVIWSAVLLAVIFFVSRYMRLRMTGFLVPVVLCLMALHTGSHLYLVSTYCLRGGSDYNALVEKFSKLPPNSVILGGNWATETAFDTPLEVIYTRNEAQFQNALEKFSGREVYFVKEDGFGDGWMDEKKHVKVFEGNVSAFTIGVYKVTREQ